MKGGFYKPILLFEALFSPLELSLGFQSFLTLSRPFQLFCFLKFGFCSFQLLVAVSSFCSLLERSLGLYSSLDRFQAIFSPVQLL